MSTFHSNKGPVTMAAHLSNIVESCMTGGHAWPDMAEYAIKSCPPGGKESTMEFFLNRSDLDDRLDEFKDTGMAWQAYEWDLGPWAMPGMHQHVFALPPTAAERTVLRNTVE